MSALLADVTWPLSRAAQAVSSLLCEVGFAAPSTCVLEPELPLDPERRAQWFEQVASSCGARAYEVDVRYAELDAMLARCAPAIIQVALAGEQRVVAIVRADHDKLWVLDSHGRRRVLARSVLRQALVTQAEALVAPELESLIDAARTPAKRRARARRAWLDERLSQLRIGGCTLLEPAPGAPLKAAVRERGLGRRLLLAIGLYALQYALLGLSWPAVQRGALAGRVDTGWLSGWLLALALAVPVQACVSWILAHWSIDAGLLLRTRLLASLLKLDPDQVRKQGSGALLVRVIEAGVLESGGLSGVLLVLFACIDLGMAALLLGAGAHAASMLAIWLLALLTAAACFKSSVRARRAWTAARFELTNAQIELMVGHRTRLVQSALQPHEPHEAALLARYLEASRRFDAAGVVVSLIPRAMTLIGLGTLAAQSLWSGSLTLPFAIAIAGTLLASRALASLNAGAQQLSAALIAWDYVAPLLRTGAVERADTLQPALENSTQPVVQARKLGLRLATKARRVLSKIDLTIAPGDRVLLLGASGSGKSSLAAVIAGLRQHDKGLLLYGGLDSQSLGSAGLDRRVSMAPQFHDNHVLHGTLAFNVLLGRRWPASEKTLQLAEVVCRELGLGPLLARMPLGMEQLVGETGWQLSHGERTRVFAARAICADAELAILDESVGALDPHTAQAALRCALDRTRSLMLIAHL